MDGVILRKYGEATTINFELFEVDGVDFRVDAVHATGDTVIMKDEGAEANTTNAFTDEGTGYSLALSATEMQSARKHLEVAERYEEMQYSHKEGTARHAELEAIKLKRLEAAENLGVKVTSTISKTIALIK